MAPVGQLGAHVYPSADDRFTIEMFPLPAVSTVSCSKVVSKSQQRPHTIYVGICRP
jgi:hypothetical protein